MAPEKERNIIFVCLSSSKVILPHPFPEVEEISLIPLIRASIASNREVTSISITLAELEGIL